MTETGRRVRAAIGVGLTWGLAWFGAGLVLLLILGTGAADVPFPLGFGMLGFLAGATFSALLGFAERGRRLENMSLKRFAAWGGAAGLLLAGGFALVAALVGDMTPLDNLDVLVPVFGLAGAASAFGSLAIARRGRERNLLEGGAEESRRLQSDAD